MKVRVSFIIHIGDKFRRAINYSFGLSGLASEQEINDWYGVNANHGVSDVMDDWTDYLDHQIAEKDLENLDPYDERIICDKLKLSLIEQKGTMKDS